MMANKKIIKGEGKAPSEVEMQVANALLDLEVSSKDLRCVSPPRPAAAAALCRRRKWRSRLARALTRARALARSADLRELYIVAAREVDLPNGKKALVVFVPFRLHKRFQKIQARLMRELEKKFASKHVIFIAQRTILGKNYSRTHPGQQRPNSRTLTTVHEKILDDVVYPTQIVGKRTRVRLDGTKLLKVYLDPKDQKEVDERLGTFAGVYKALTGKNVEFLFPDN